jgi:hypothetical protein
LGEAFEVDFFAVVLDAVGFDAVDFELPFFDAERDFEVLRLLELFCFVWAILTLLSMESFRGANYPRRNAVKPRGKRCRYSSESCRSTL